MIVRVVKTIEADSYEEAERKARMLDVPSAWCNPDESWDTDETTFGSTPTIDLNELSNSWLMSLMATLRVQINQLAAQLYEVVKDDSEYWRLSHTYGGHSVEVLHYLRARLRAQVLAEKPVECPYCVIAVPQVCGVRYVALTESDAHRVRQDSTLLDDCSVGAVLCVDNTGQEEWEQPSQVDDPTARWAIHYHLHG